MSFEVAICHDYGDFCLDVSFRIEQPGITALFGPSGAGKTSVINAIAGVLRPKRGHILINGRVVLNTDQKIFVAPRERRVGYVFQDARLFPHLNVMNNLRFGWRRAERRASEDEVRHLVNLLGLEKLLKRRPRTLSGGERARVALGRALLASPEILLLDEPLAALDVSRKSEILPYLERLGNEVKLPVVYVSHSLDEVSRVADHVIVLRQGRIALSGPIFEVLTDLSLPDYTGSSPFGALLDATVSEHGSEDGLSILSFAGGKLVVPSVGRTIGSRLRVRVRAEDVMLAVAEPVQISANNILPVIISEIQPRSPSHADIRLLCGPTPLVARITGSSTNRLGLRAGQKVYAIIKSVTVAAQTDLPMS